MSTIKLTAEELQAAKAAGLTPEEYAAFKSPRPDPKVIEQLHKREST